MASESDTQQRILDAARELIHSRSYADVGIAAICDKAGVQKGSFYHFFPSKRDLTLAVLDDFVVWAKQGLVDRAFDPQLPPLARLQRLTELAYEIQKQLVAETGMVLGCPFGNLATEMATQDEAIRHKIAHIFDKFQATFAALLQEAKGRGDLGGIDCEATAQAMLAYFEGVMMLAKTQNDPEVLRQLLPTMTQIRIPAKH